MMHDLNPDAVYNLMVGPEEEMEEMLDTWTCLLTTQMSAKKGIKVFGEAGEQAIMKELEQLLYWKVMKGHDPKTIPWEHKQAALKYLMFLKKKHCGRIKGCGCADGQKQRVYKM